MGNACARRWTTLSETRFEYSPLASTKSSSEQLDGLWAESASIVRISERTRRCAADCPSARLAPAAKYVRGSSNQRNRPCAYGLVEATLTILMVPVIHSRAHSLRTTVLLRMTV